MAAGHANSWIRYAESRIHMAVFGLCAVRVEAPSSARDCDCDLTIYEDTFSQGRRKVGAKLLEASNGIMRKIVESRVFTEELQLE